MKKEQLELRVEELVEEMIAIHYKLDDFGLPQKDDIGTVMTVLERLDYLPKRSSISCQCKEEDKHGETTIWCCNNCGLPVEKFWNYTDTAICGQCRKPLKTLGNGITGVKICECDA